MRVVMLTFQPSPTSPKRWVSGMRTSLKKTSLKLDRPLICLMGLISTPGERISRKKNVKPLCLGTVGSVRVTRMP